jgi:molybdopterin synthase catalytic subunit
MDEAKITEEEIDVSSIIEEVKDYSSGGIVIFLGTVRNFSEAGKVREIEYEAYDEMALKKMKEIIAYSKEKWPLRKVRVVHRKGKLSLGEVSVAIAVSAPHRKEAFEACRYIIDSVKGEVAIWKKERLDDGKERWVESHNEDKMFKRETKQRHAR